jgi:8-oxo-dGTP diphosphatase
VTDYPRPSVTADVVAFTLVAGELAVLLIRRGRDPFAGMWALPGGFCEPGETVGAAAVRELEEETGLRGLAMEELATMSRPGRDPRGWVIGVAHLGFVPPERLGEAKGSDDATDAGFFSIAPDRSLRRGGEVLRELAFDHDDELRLALDRLAASPERFAPALLPATFDLPALARTCAALARGPVQADRLLSRARDDGRVVEAAGGFARGPRAFPRW